MMKLQTSTFAIFLLSLFSLLLSATATAAAPPLPPSPPSDPSCSDELVRFSVCLPFISSSPNNLTDTPPIQCCDDFASAYNSNHSVCLCYLIHHPPILGFPINSTRLFSLPSLCPVVERKFRANISLQSLCSGSDALPPLHSITGLEHGRPKSHPEQQSQAESNGSLDDYTAPEPTADSSPEFTADSPTEEDSEMPTSSSPTMLMKNRYGWVCLSVIFFLIVMQ